MTEHSTHVEHPRCRCRRCKLVRFAEGVLQLLDDGVPAGITRAAAEHSDSGDGGLTSEEYALLFESQVRELRKEAMQ